MRKTVTKISTILSNAQCSIPELKDAGFEKLIKVIDCNNANSSVMNSTTTVPDANSSAMYSKATVPDVSSSATDSTDTVPDVSSSAVAVNLVSMTFSLIALTIAMW